ncbi:nucleoside-diphosphate-sugar epimerase [Paraburkholderia bannensis]|uniref:Nucleoside-diphosphate-sugar epimerase n=1 Tax=Paraburkholderia bannensis TaxID=765414 RepID=A0A7W9WSD9_9BURK|nr:MULTISPECIES: NAD-dependent epimerase/dehydratase family protein [Paraburkholderia]MBB3257382.1 nucleoside-diphosphate-sugar epimerase [Paraburkholderia sp. WP4_3_2]MBB6102222.1 nucleoside-diphosphate-sugar epimerase [Paraburkholderia bannensis]
MAANIGETAAQQSQQAQQARGTALVLGVSGGIGGEVARQLSGAGWRVRALQRKPGGDAVRAGGIETVQGDVMDRDAVMRAAQGCEVIVHAVNPPGYRRWAELVLPMIDNTLAAAQAARATVVLPGTVYNYGPAALPLVAEDAPQQPRTRKGAIRVELERRIEAATAREVRAIVLRAGDFFGPRVGNSWLAQGFLTPGQPLRAVREPGTPGVGHCWGYVPDVARAMLELIEQRAALAPFARFHMAGHWDADGTQMVAAICRVAARHGLTIKRGAFPWPLIYVAALFSTTPREMLEMRYLWRETLELDNTRLVQTLGREPHTPLDTAVEATLAGLGCLPSGQGRMAAAH